MDDIHLPVQKAEITDCLHRVVANDAGYGCRTCDYDPVNNKNCPAYQPIRVGRFTVYEKEILLRFPEQQTLEKIAI